MRVDPPGLTGPPTTKEESSASITGSTASRGQRNQSASPIRFELESRESLSARFFCVRSDEDPDSPNRRRTNDFDSPVKSEQREDRRDDEREARNATAFHVSHDFASRNPVEARTRALTTIFETERQDPRSRRCNDDQRDDRNGSACPVDCPSSTPRRPNLRPPSRRKKRGRRKTKTGSNSVRDEGRADIEDPVDLCRIPTADASNVPSVDVLANTAYNDDANHDGSSRDIVSQQNHDHLLREIASRDLRIEEIPEESPEEVASVRGRASYLGFDTWPCENLKVPANRCYRRLPRCRPTSGKSIVEREDTDSGGWSDNTARLRKPIGKKVGGSSEGQESDEKESATTARKLRLRGRKNGLLFILYLLVWPLLCSTNPSGQFASAFAQNPSLVRTENLPQRNATHFSSFLSSGTGHQQQQQQQQQHQQQQQQSQQSTQQREKQQQYLQDGDYGSNGNGHHHHLRHEEQEQQEQAKEGDPHQGPNQGVLESETVHPYNEYSWEVNQINPWLSACDLAGPAPADLLGSCGPPEVPKNCPAPCASRSRGAGNDDLGFYEVIERVEVSERVSWSAGKKGKRLGSRKPESNASARKESSDRGRVVLDGVRTAPEQCLFYLEESHKRDICRDDFGRTSTTSFLTPRENRYWFVSGLRLRHCCEHAVVNALAPGKGGPFEDVLNGGRKCADALDKLLIVDALAARLHCEFEEVLARYDCAQSYSVIHNCTHCKEAYRKWVCSSLVPYFAHGGPLELETMEGSWTGSRIRACRSFCQSVEQRCPYLLPGDRAPAYPTQYAGEPTFLCRDPNIPETGEQSARALHSSVEDECCFHVCSEEEPGSGICANCTDQGPRKRGRNHDPPTAPHCEISPIQSVSTGQQYPQTVSLDRSFEEDQDGDSSSMTSISASSIPSIQQQQGSSLCGSGGVGSIPSVSSSVRSSPSILLQALYLCSILIGLLNSVRANLLLPWIAKFFRRLANLLPGTEKSQLGGVCVWLHRQTITINVIGANGWSWTIKKWLTIEDRCRGWWWWWWWWRWCCQCSRRRSRSRCRWKSFHWRPKAHLLPAYATLSTRGNRLAVEGSSPDTLRRCSNSRNVSWSTKLIRVKCMYGGCRGRSSGRVRWKFHWHARRKSRRSRANETRCASFVGRVSFYFERLINRDKSCYPSWVDRLILPDAPWNLRTPGANCARRAWRGRRSDRVQWKFHWDTRRCSLPDYSGSSAVKEDYLDPEEFRDTSRGPSEVDRLISRNASWKLGHAGVKCRCRGWCWLCWWWRSRRRCRERVMSGNVCEGRRAGDSAARRRGRRRRSGGRRRRRRKKRRRRTKAPDVVGEDVWHSPARRRHFRLSSRKDPP